MSWVYVSGENILLKLTPDLQLNQVVSTGPVDDNNKCLPAPSACQIPRIPTDNFGRVLEIGDNLLVCGSARLGLCSVHSMANISVSRDLDPTNQRNYVGSKNRTFAFFSKSTSANTRDRVLYAGVTYDNRPINLSSKMFASRVLRQKNEKYEFEYLLHDKTMQWVSALDISSQIKQMYLIQTIYGFELRNFVYFLTVQRESLDSVNYHTRLGRVCQGDHYYLNYMEIPLQCRKHGVLYNIAMAAWLHQVESVYSAEDLGTRLRENLLYVTFGKSHPGSSFPDPRFGSALCVYRMRHVVPASYLS
ncbi:hepatocyte growth factor receptor-like [Liolophura sinensis]|uniref:hepatocyte growth factor receptor-like n=1 Tax=Liolophura sinensis TaxID=3198878 RepID=UPI0031594489